MSSLDGSKYSSESGSKVSEPSSLPSKIGWRFKSSFGLLCVVNLVCAIDATILSVALPTIAKKLNGTAIEAFWVGTSYLLTSTVFQPIWASFSHIIDRKSVLIATVVIFTVGSIICSIANDFTWLLAGRCVQGVGGGGISALTYVIVSDMIALRERGKWFGAISLQWAIGAAIGPVLGGAFAETNWRWIFWINLPFCSVGLVGIMSCLRLNAREGKTWERLRVFDWMGAFLFVGSTTSFLVPLTWGGVSYPWNHWKTVAPLAVGALGIFAFLTNSYLFASDPLIRGSIFSSLSGSVSYMCTTIHGIILWSVLYYIPLYFEVAKTFTPMKAGMALFPFTLSLGPAAVVVGVIIAVTGRYRPSVWIGWFLAAVGTGFLVYLQEETTTVSWVILCLIPGLGYGILYPAMSFAVQAPASNSDLPFAAAMFSFFRSLGQTLGVAIGGVIFQNTLKYKIENDPTLSDYGKADDWSKDASALVQVISAVPAGQRSLREGLVHAYVDALKIVWVVMATFACVAAVGCWCCTEEISLDRELVTEQGFNYGREVELESGVDLGTTKNGPERSSAVSESQGSLEKRRDVNGGRLSTVIE